MEKLPKSLREKAISMFMQGLDSEDVFEELSPLVRMPEDELRNCIRRLKGEATKRKRSLTDMVAVSPSRASASPIGSEQPSRETLVLGIDTPRTGRFEPGRYAALRERIISSGSNHKAAEPYFAIIARDILEEKEKFRSVADIPGPSSGRPFDLIAKKEKRYAIIELKGSLHGYGSPDQIQRARMKDLISYLNHYGVVVSPYLLQISLDQGVYRLWDPDCIKVLFEGIDPNLGKSMPVSEFAGRIAAIVKTGVIPKEALIQAPGAITIRGPIQNPLFEFAHSERIVRPPEYLKRKIEPDITSNAVKSEVVWTYLVAYAYEKHLTRLIERLCGKSETLPPNPHIWLEAYLHPTRKRQQEGRYWKTRSDLALGWLDRVPNNTKHQIQSNGDWLIIVEAKFLDDLHENANFPDIVQFSQLIEHALYMPAQNGKLPERVYVTLITPCRFKEKSAPYRKYRDKFTQYTTDRGALIEDLKKCPLDFIDGLDQERLVMRVNHLRLNWVTFEDLLGLDDLVECTSPGKPTLKIKSWGMILERVNDVRAGKF